MAQRILVTGAAGFIGHHLVRRLKEQGHWVRGVDWKKPEYGCAADEFLLLDLRDMANAKEATKGIDKVYALAADMGGMGFIQDPANQYPILFNNTMINFNTLEASIANGVKRLLFSSSACIYPKYLQRVTEVKALKEEDAYPAQPQDTYGWEKLQMEHLCLSAKTRGIETRMARFHNIYGPEGTWKGGREKSPAAMCRKVLEAIKEKKGHIEVWGDGEQTRSFCYIDDCLKGLDLVMEGAYEKPVNLGRSEMVSINELASTVMEIAGAKLEIKHVDGPMGVRGRNSDNTMFRKLYGWEPEVDLKSGMVRTYSWIAKAMG